MSVFKSRPAMRWLVPAAAAAVVIGGGAAAGTIVASADPALPERSAAQLLVDLQSADPKGLSGTVVQSTDLGLPGVAGLLGKVQGNGGNLASLIAGSNTARVWYAGEEKVRFALIGANNETDVIRNGSDVWLWDSQQKKASHAKVPANLDSSRRALPSEAPVTPQEAAGAALAAIEPSTDVKTTGAARVAGRDAYELLLSPKDSASLVGQVRLAVDAEQHIPLRVEVYAKNATKPSIRVAFEQISFTVPDDEQFRFNPPPGTKVDEVSQQLGSEKAAELTKKRAEELQKQRPDVSAEPKVIGEGWTSVVEVRLPKPQPKSTDKAEAALDPAKLMEALPKVSGSWGSGRLLQGALFSVLLTDDGRVLAGAVSPEKLYELA